MIDFFVGRTELYASESDRDRAVRVMTAEGIEAKIRNDGVNGGIFITISPSNAKKIASALDKNGIIVYINSVYGFKDICVKLRKRLGLLIGALLFTLILAMSTEYVFRVEVIGAETVARDAIRSELAELGVRVGARIRDIDRAEAVSAFLRAHPEYSWAAINLKGNAVRLELRERADGESADTELSDLIISGYDGIIREITVYSGKSAVRVGDVVKKGELLVCGYISGSGLQYSDAPLLRFDGASGRILAEVTESVSVSVPYSEEHRSVTNKETVGCVISFLGHSVTLGTVGNDGDLSLGAERGITVFGSIELPLTYRPCVRSETEAVTVTRDGAEAMIMARTAAYAQLTEKLSGAALTYTEITEEITDIGASVTVRYGAIRDISVPVNRVQSERKGQWQKEEYR